MALHGTISRSTVLAPGRCKAPLLVRQHGVRVVRVAATSYGSQAETDQMSSEDIKAALLDSFWGTGRGLTASSETRAEINELITQLEAVTPCPNPTEAMDMLDGTWKLVYTSNSELMALLALGKLPLLTVEDITQTVSSYSSTVVNSLSISSPLSRSAFSTTASVEVRSPKRLQLLFEKGTISTPELATDLELPESISIMGQTVDLSAAKSALAPVRDAGQGIVSQIANIISQQPDLNIPIRNEKAQTWLLTTYLDNTLRINRGDGGSVFVLVKDATAGVSSTSSYAAAYTPTTEMTDAATLSDDPSMAAAEEMNAGEAEENAGLPGASVEGGIEALGVSYSASVSGEGADDKDTGFELNVEPLGLNVKASMSDEDEEGGKSGDGDKKEGNGTGFEAKVGSVGVNMKASVDDGAEDKDGKSKDSRKKGSEGNDEEEVAGFEASVEPLGLNVKASVTSEEEEEGEGKGKDKGKDKKKSKSP